MSETLRKTSKTEFLIAIDDEDSDEDNDEIKNDESLDIYQSVAKTLNQVLDIIESKSPIEEIDNTAVDPSHCLPTLPIIEEIDGNQSDKQISQSDTNEPQVEEVVESDDSINGMAESEEEIEEIVAKDKQLIGDRLVRPVEDLEDIENMEVNIITHNDVYSFELDDLEAEDCMIIDSFAFGYDRDFDEPNKKTNEDDDEIEIIEESDGKQDKEDKEVIDLSDDEEECVIINDTFKSPKLLKLEGRATKRPNSPDFWSESFIPLSQPSTSSQSNFRPVTTPSYWRSADQRRAQSFQRSLNNSFHSSYSSPASTTSLFRSSDNQTYVETTHVTRRVSSSYIQPINTSNNESFSNTSNTMNSSPATNQSSNVSEEEELIPFLYEDPKPSTSNDTNDRIGSSNVQDVDLIANCVQLDRRIVRNVLDLIEDQCTIPFIVRYRQSVISGIDADRVRKINSIYNELKNARERAKDVEQTLRKQDRLNPKLVAALNRCKNVFEVEHLYRLCRNESGNSEKYRNLGLSDSAISVLEGKRLDPNHFVNRFAFCLDSADSVKEGWAAIISDIISKDCDVLEFLIGTTKQHTPVLQVLFDEDKARELSHESDTRNIDTIQKYIRFNELAKPVDKINAHTIMAIERGESLGLLNIFIEFDTNILNKLIDFCLQKWNRCISHLLVSCVRTAFNTTLRPSLEEYIRWELRHSAHMTALDVFRNNVKYLLLEPPLKGEYVIGVDPGHGSGYKVALVSPWLVPLNTFILKLDLPNYESSAAKLRKLMQENNCSIIALGNGTGCRRFEDMLQQRIQSGFFGNINVKYKIINESGVSWYSVTEEARRELPHHNPQMIGAICIARRLIDPLSELVKVDPKRLQVGMYMRDIDGEAIRKTFHEVSVECVSFCGVDVNTASLEVLSKVAGLEPTLARLIIEKRERDGLIKSRSQLKNIDGIGWKQFEQCAGFIKVMSLTRRDPTYSSLNDSDLSNKRTASSTDDYDPLDSTIIHPESYSCANTYIELIGATKNEIGKQSIRLKITNANKKYSLDEMAQLCNTHTTNMKLIIEGLSNSTDFDYRTNFAQIYIPDIQRFQDLTVGMNLRGRVVNVTPMGAFIDCGIVGGINAYIKAKECDRHSIVVNDQVLVNIETINRVQQRFSALIVKVFKNNINFV